MYEENLRFGVNLLLFSVNLLKNIGHTFFISIWVKNIKLVL